MDVAPTTSAARCHAHTLSRLDEVGYHVEGFHGRRVELAHLRALGHLEHEILAIAPVPARTLAMCCAACAEVMLEAIVHERRELRVTREADAAARATVATIGTALGHEGLTPERHAAGTTIAAAHVDASKVSKAACGHVILLCHPSWY